MFSITRSRLHRNDHVDATIALVLFMLKQQKKNIGKTFERNKEIKKLRNK